MSCGRAVGDAIPASAGRLLVSCGGELGVTTGASILDAVFSAVAGGSALVLEEASDISAVEGVVATAVKSAMGAGACSAVFLAETGIWLDCTGVVAAFAVLTAFLVLTPQPIHWNMQQP